MVGNLKLIAGCLYHEGKDGILRLCIDPSKQAFYLTQAYQSFPRIHFVGRKTAQVLLRLGVFWPSMYQDTYTFVQQHAHFQLSR